MSDRAMEDVIYIDSDSDESDVDARKTVPFRTGWQNTVLIDLPDLPFRPGSTRKEADYPVHEENDLKEDPSGATPSSDSPPSYLPSVENITMMGTIKNYPHNSENTQQLSPFTDGHETRSDSPEDLDGCMLSPSSLDSSFFCQSEDDTIEFSDDSESLHEPSSPTVFNVHRALLQDAFLLNKDNKSMNICDNENEPETAQPDFTSFTPSLTSFRASPPLTPDLVNNTYSPTSSENFASDPLENIPHINPSGSTGSFPVSRPPTPHLDYTSLDLGFLEAISGESNENEPYDRQEDADKQHICLTQYNKLKLYFGESVPYMKDEENYGPAEPLCRQSLNLVNSTIEEKHPEGTLQLLSDFIQPRYYPPVVITKHLLRGILLDPQISDVLATEAFNLLMRTQRYHPVDVSFTPWDWELVVLVMENKLDSRKEIQYLFVQYVLQVLEDDFNCKLETQRLQHSIAKMVISCDQCFGHVREVIEWIMEAAITSVSQPNSVEHPTKRDQCLKLVLSLQRMLTLALEVDKNPACNSGKLSQELFQHLELKKSRQIRLLLLNALKSQLLKFKLLELLLDQACSVKRSLPMSLSLMLHYLQTCKLAPDPSDGAEQWRKWDELLKLVWMLILSYEEVMTGDLYRPITERCNMRKGPYWTENDKVKNTAVQEAIKAFLSRAKKDTRQELPSELLESLSQLEEHFYRISIVISDC